MDYGLIGMPLGHSFSAEIHDALGWYTYELNPVDAREFDAFMQARNFRGINVTIPYKQAVIPYLDEIDPLAQEIGAVNCVINKQGKLYGYNTDLLGMQALAQKMNLNLRGKHVLICGTGGTSKTARAMAHAAGAASVARLSRTPKTDEDTTDVITYAQAYNNHANAHIIINTTPCGMFPNNTTQAINAAAFPQLEGIIDAVYNPLETPLVQQGHALGVPAEGGLYMLVAQAVKAAQYFMSVRPTHLAQAAHTSAHAKNATHAAHTGAHPEHATHTTQDAHPTHESHPAHTDAQPPINNAEFRALCNKMFNRLEREKRNIVLIGMPGSGKTSVGTLLAEKLGRTFIDTDQVVCDISGKTPEHIITTAGEAAFRSIESEAVAQASKNTGCVISTGGGVILRPENSATLKQNGTLYFIDRPLEQLLPTHDRPLANSAEKLVQLYDERYPRYAACADFTIPVTGSAVLVAQCIQERHFHENFGY